MDEDGNAIPLSIPAARQFLSESQIINQLNRGQTIRVQNLPTSVGIQEGTELEMESDTEPDIGPDMKYSSISAKGNTLSRIAALSSIKTSAQDIKDLQVY